MVRNLRENVAVPSTPDTFIYLMLTLKIIRLFFFFFFPRALYLTVFCLVITEGQVGWGLGSLGRWEVVLPMTRSWN